MACPGDIGRLASYLRRVKKVVSSDDILERVGGDPVAWFEHLKSAKVAASLSAANTALAVHNLEAVSIAQNSELWEVITCAEARARSGYKQVLKAPKTLLNASESFWAVVQDERAEAKLRGDCAAWLKLFNEDKYGEYAIFQLWAKELADKAKRLLGPGDGDGTLH